MEFRRVRFRSQWDVEVRFAASVVNQRFAIEQEGNEVKGTHFASMGPRELVGTLHGKDILVRSAYSLQGMRINFEFTGKVNGDTMGGNLSLAEYGKASWKAKRHTYEDRKST